MARRMASRPVAQTATWPRQLWERVPDEHLVLGLVFALFISSWLAGAVVVFIAGRLIWRGEIPSLFASVPGAWALPAFCLLSMATSLSSANQTGFLAAFGFLFLSVTALFVRTRMTRDLFERIVDAACAASIPGFLAIAIQRLNGPRNPEFRAPSLFLNANFYAAVTAIVILMCLHRLLERNRPNRWLHAGCALANLAGLYLSDSRSGIAALAIAMILLLLFNRRHAILVLAALAGILALVIVFMQPELFPRYARIGADIPARIAIWKTAFRGFLQYPITGLGMQGYTLIHGRFGGPPTVHAHNLLLDPLLDYGLAGIFLLGRYGMESLRSMRRLLAAGLDPGRLRLLAAILASILVHGMTDNPVGSLQNILLVMILAGVAGLAERRPQPGPGNRPKTWPRLRRRLQPQRQPQPTAIVAPVARRDAPTVTIRVVSKVKPSYNHGTSPLHPPEPPASAHMPRD